MGYIKHLPFLSVPPAFQVKPKDTNVTVGQPLILHCQTTGFPQPTVAWHKDGYSVDTSHVTLLSNGSLYISSSVVQDTGRFSCRATNIVGSLTVMANIVIYGGYIVSVPAYCRKLEFDLSNSF